MMKQSGQGMVEYGLIIGLIAIIVVSVFVALGPQISAFFSEIIDAETINQAQEQVSSELSSDEDSAEISITCDNGGSWKVSTNQAVTATVTDRDGNPRGGISVTLQLNMVDHCYISGVSQGGASGTDTKNTSAAGTVTWTGCQEHNSAGSGSATVSANVDGDNVSATQPITINW